MIARDEVMEPFLDATSMYSHGVTFGGHPVMCAIALKNIEIMKREGIVEHVRDAQDVFRAKLETLLDLPIVGDVRGTGFFYARRGGHGQGDTRDVRRRRVRDAAARLRLAGAVRRRADLPQDDRGDPVVQISPPLVAGEAEMDEIVGILGDVLTEACEAHALSVTRWGVTVRLPPLSGPPSDRAC